MKLHLALASLIGLASLAFSARAAEPVNLDDLPPVVIKTVPESGATDVPPGPIEVRVTFSKTMRDASWSFYCASEIDSAGLYGSKPRFESDRRTFVMKVNTQPNRSYAFWANSPTHNNFRDAKGNRGLPYLIVFKTAAK